MREIRKKSTWEAVTTFFWKISAKSTNFEISSLGLGIFDEVSVSNFSFGLGIFDESSVSKFEWGFGLEGYGLDYITAI